MFLDILKLRIENKTKKTLRKTLLKFFSSSSQSFQICLNICKLRQNCAMPKISWQSDLHGKMNLNLAVSYYRQLSKYCLNQGVVYVFCVILHGTLAVVPFQTILMSQIYNFWKLIVATVIMQSASDGFYLEEMPTRVTQYIKYQMIADGKA